MFKSKVLSKAEYDALKEKASYYDKIVASIVKGNPNLKAEDVTIETIEELMKSDSENETDPDLQSKFDTLQGKYDTLKSEKETLETKNEELEEQVHNLLNGAAEEPAKAKSKGEPGAQEESLAEFFQKNSGDHAAIISRMQKDGLI